MKSKRFVKVALKRFGTFCHHPGTTNQNSKSHLEDILKCGLYVDIVLDGLNGCDDQQFSLKTFCRRKHYFTYVNISDKQVEIFRGIRLVGYHMCSPSVCYVVFCAWKKVFKEPDDHNKKE